MSEVSERSELITDVREQILFLQELGVDSFAVDFPERGEHFEDNSSELTVESSQFGPGAVPVLPKKMESPKSAASRLGALPSLANRSRAKADTPIVKIEKNMQTKPAPEETLFEVAPTLEATEDTIESIRADIGNCTRCPLNEGRTQIVHTAGNFQADLMFVGEAPGADEDAQGFPFVGRAGQLLTKIIESIGFKREEVCIGNINRCRPPGNRQPTLPEAHTCRPFLLREIAVIRPKVIVVLGNTALHNLLDTKVGITKVRGQFQDYFGVKVMPTFHPAYLLRDPHKKREVWEDMKKVRDYLTEKK